MRSGKLAEDIRFLVAPADPLRAARPSKTADAERTRACQAIIALPRTPSARRRYVTPLRAAGVLGAVCAVVVSVIVAVQLRTPAPASGAATPAMLQYVLAGYDHPASSSALPPARTQLLHLARLAAGQPAQAHAPAASIGYVVTREWNMTTAVAGGTSASVLTPQGDQTWTTSGGLTTQVQRQGQPLLLSGAQSPSELVRAAESGPVQGRQTFPTSSVFGPPVQDLPTDPTHLQADLASGFPYYFSGPISSYGLIKAISALQHQVVLPRLESALWQVLASRSDIRYMGLVRDRAGRLGQAVCVTATGAGRERLVLIISARTGMLLGEEDLMLANPGGLTIKSYPAVIGYITYLTNEWVGAIPK
jgi:hypothetical protein